MSAATRLRLSENILVGLFYISRYRFLTISQFAKMTGLTYTHASEALHTFDRHGMVGFFGNVRLAGAGKTPKAYFLKRKGFDILKYESGIPEELIGSFVEVHKETSWSPQMFHRLRLVDLFVALEVAVRERPHLNLVKSFLEYRRVKKGGRIARETTDFVDREEIPEHRIIPDGAFVLENVETGRRALFFVEMDMATERIISRISHDKRMSLHFKFEQYDRYLQNLLFAETYAKFGTFGHFTLLFVTRGGEADKRPAGPL